MESSNNHRDKAPIGPLLPPSETSSAKNGWYLIELLAKEPNGNPKTTQAIAKYISCSAQTHGKALLMKKHLHTSLNMEIVR